MSKGIKRFHPKKSWGQHLLVDPYVLDSIASSVQSENNILIEFASGTGNLTEYLLSKGYRVIAIEMEREAVTALKERFSGKEGIEILEENMMKFDFELYYKRYGRMTVVGNLPYNLSKVFLFKVFDNSPFVKDAYLMFQLEVARRIVADVGEKEWSPMSVFARILSEPEIVMVVKRGSFFPPPKVESALVHLRFNSDENTFNFYKRYNRLIQEVFNYSRKTLKSIIRLRFGDEYIQRLERVLDLSKRPQNLTLNELKIICEVIDE